MTPSEVVGRRVKEARVALKMSQKRLGELLEPFLGTEWAPQAVSAAEQGRRRFDAAELLALGMVLERPVSWFLSPPGSDVEVQFPGGEVLDAKEMVGSALAPDHLEASMYITQRLDVAQETLRELLRELTSLRRSSESLTSELRHAGSPKRGPAQPTEGSGKRRKKR
jgi:transcriptional regulator with XRE-family HTH domain